MSVKNIVSKLSTPEKIELYNCLYTDLAGKGIDGDTELAHVNVEEMQVLRDMGGSGTVNPHTGLIQFGGGSGGGSPAPAPSQSTIQKETIPDELKPFVTDVLEKSKALQERREEEGYVPFEGPRIARFTPEQEQAFAGVQTLQGASQPYFRTAEALTASSALAPTATKFVPVVFTVKAPFPMAVLLFAVVFASNAKAPTAVFEAPVVLSCKADFPIPVLKLAVVLSLNAS